MPMAARRVVPGTIEQNRKKERKREKDKEVKSQEVEIEGNNVENKTKQIVNNEKKKRLIKQFSTSKKENESRLQDNKRQ